MKMKKQALFLGKLLISSGLIFLLYRKIPVSDIKGMLLSVEIWYMLPIFMLLVLNTLLSSLKWQLFLRADGVRIPYAALMWTYMIGSFYNMFLPSNIGGDSYRIYDVARMSKEGVRTAASVFADRVSGFLALVILGLLSSIVVAFRFDELFFFLGPLLILVIVGLVLVALFKQTPVRIFLKVTRLDRVAVIQRLTDKLFLSFSCYGADRRLLVQVMAISFAFQCSVICIVYLLALSLHATVPFIYFSAFVPLVALLEVLPLSINGIGLRDAGYVFFFGWAGMTDIQTRSLGLLFLAMSVCYSLLGGLVYLCRIFSRLSESDNGQPSSSANPH